MAKMRDYIPIMDMITIVEQPYYNTRLIDHSILNVIITPHWYDRGHQSIQKEKVTQPQEIFI